MGLEQWHMGGAENAKMSLQSKMTEQGIDPNNVDAMANLFAEEAANFVKFLPEQTMEMDSVPRWTEEAKDVLTIFSSGSENPKINEIVEKATQLLKAKLNQQDSGFEQEI